MSDPTNLPKGDDAVSQKLSSMLKSNPAEAPAKQLPSRTRIPMSVPQLKLAVPEIPGYRCRWMRGDAQRIMQAKQGGYEFVTRDEVNLNTFGLGNGEDSDGSTDLGNRVSIAAGGSDTADGQAARMYLMKIPNEFWDQDSQLAAERQEAVAAQLRGDDGFSKAGMDKSHRYTRGEQRTNMFHPRRS
jgi:hypothetical protein